MTASQTQITDLQTLLGHFSRSGNDIVISGANLWITSGLGTTHGGGTVNGLGNLIVGYNELRGAGNVRTGSHNIIVGSENNYSSYGGLVTGSMNTIAAVYATVCGGQLNIAGGQFSSVSGGTQNTASGQYATVGGGAGRSATGNQDWVAGALGQDF